MFTVLCLIGFCCFLFLPSQAPVHVCNKGGAGGDVRVSAGTGEEGGARPPATGGGGADDPAGVRTLPHEDNQLSGESQSGLRLHQLLKLLAAYPLKKTK